VVRKTISFDYQHEESMAIKPLTPNSFDHIAPSGIQLRRPATEAQRKLLTAAGYAETTEADVRALGLGNLPDKSNIWWATRWDPDLIPREALFREDVQKEEDLGDGRGSRDDPNRDDRGMDRD
jgi:hypothetical protein